jgi:hypothetical protein
VLPKTNLSLYANEVTKTQLELLFDEAHVMDPFPHQVLIDLRSGVRQRKDISLSLCTELDRQLHYDKKIVCSRI